MSQAYLKPVLVNPTWPTVGDDSYTLDSTAYMKRVTSNPGNMVFLYALTQEIEGLKHYKAKGYTGCDMSVWGCSNFIHHRREMLTDHPVFKSFDTNYVAIGLGAQAPNYDFVTDVPEGTLSWLNEIISRAHSEHPNITVRGPHTYSILKKYGLEKHAVIMGCPSLFINPATNLGEELSRKFTSGQEKVAVTPGYVGNCAKIYEQIERSLAQIATEYGGGYICQGPEEVIHMVRGEYQKADPERVAKANKTLFPDLEPDVFRKWFKRHSMVFGAVPPWMEYLRTCDLVMGTRIHGTILALQSGTPALCIALDARHRELCETMLVPWVWWEDVKDGITVADAVELLKDVDWYEFDRNRKKLAREYITFLTNNGLKASAAVAAIAKA